MRCFIMPENNGNHLILEAERDFEDKFCLLKAQRALEEFVQLKILAEIIDEETNLEQKQVLQDVYKEEKEEFYKSKADLDQCLYVNGSLPRGGK